MGSPSENEAYIDITSGSMWVIEQIHHEGRITAIEVHDSLTLAEQVMKQFKAGDIKGAYYIREWRPI
jgi:hypothetical protein